ncbi:hypothetical protein [Campylobacter sp. RM16187]|uniref:hypothetical protein n=1 Tax=Campylobacter sp. RM16187 TaxID=1660063 RepID=UPI0021B5A0A0|nr:hypothetical protein [Campylobacter sp. RM16187]QKG29211.1 hypothetical protein CDOMF_0949 [Campylobacter sp. RM16187]
MDKVTKGEFLEIHKTILEQGFFCHSTNDLIKYLKESFNSLCKKHNVAAINNLETSTHFVFYTQQEFHTYCIYDASRLDQNDIEKAFENYLKNHNKSQK